MLAGNADEASLQGRHCGEGEHAKERDQHTHPEKLGTEGSHHVAELSDVDDLVINAGTSAGHLHAFANAGIRVHQLPH
ncbi:hypothetical protein [Stenotrophomonas sp.]|uniref:hypothetical protein n=1 Tax=Stenotrophomonas sp. TaxID=69392 RepID=UPI0028B03ADC|nr:hypothetical protein [Stenotrophomonas sp.]